MPNVSTLNVLLHGRKIGALSLLQGDRILFGFDANYVADRQRATLSLSFKQDLGGLATEIAPTQRRVPPFFANLLPEGGLRKYLAERAGVKPEREFFLIWMLGSDLPGAVTVEPADGDDRPPDDDGMSRGRSRERNALRFSLAGVQLKFSAVRDAAGGLTIPADGMGGRWIVKLPSPVHKRVPENEFSMLTLAGMIGIDVPKIHLVAPESIGGLPAEMATLDGQALAVERFDRGPDGAVHIEDFAQVFGVYPEEKYGKASYRSVAKVIAAETGNAGVAEFVRRLVFNALIGNGDMHLKNWSLIYPDGHRAALAPAYDFVSTIPYIVNDMSALSFGRTKRMDEFSWDELLYLAGKARLPEKLVRDAAEETVARFHETWPAERRNLPISKAVAAAIDKHIDSVPIARGSSVAAKTARRPR